MSAFEWDSSVHLKDKKESVSDRMIATKPNTTERIPLISILTQNTLHFNKSIKLSNDGGELSSDTGNVIFQEFDEKSEFSEILQEHLLLPDERTFCIQKTKRYFSKKSIG